MKCDKCGREVEPRNNGALLLSGITDLTYQSRHLLPVEGCEGSPSLAQFLEGQPRDSRPGDRPPYDHKFESAVRAAYRRLQEL